MHSSLLISVLFVKLSVHKCMHLITNIQIHPNVGRAENSENGAADKSLTVPSSPLAPQSSNASSSQRIRHHRPSRRQINIYNIISKKSCEIHWNTRYEWFNDDNHELRWLHTCPNAGNKMWHVHPLWERSIYIFCYRPACHLDANQYLKDVTKCPCKTGCLLLLCLYMYNTCVSRICIIDIWWYMCVTYGGWWNSFVRKRPFFANKNVTFANFRELHVYLSRGPCWATTPLMENRSPPAKLRQRFTDHFLIAFSTCS